MPLAINFCKTPSIQRNKMYEFHVDGMGGYDTSTRNWEPLGEYPLFIEPTEPIRLFAETAWGADVNTTIRAYGYDVAGNWIRSSENGVVVDGELVPVVYSNNPAPDSSPFPEAPAASGAPPPTLIPNPPRYNCVWPFTVIISRIVRVPPQPNQLPPPPPQGGFIIYTTDGTQPTWSHGTMVSGQTATLSLVAATTVRAINALSQFDISSEVTGLYSDQPQPPIEPPLPPLFSPPGGYNITFPINVAIDQQARGNQGIIIYTTDGTDPTWTNGTHDTTHQVLTLNSTTTLKAICARSSSDVSSITIAVYSSAPPPPPSQSPLPPVMTPPEVHGAIFPISVSVDQQSVDNQGIIIYTTDGTDPTWLNGTHDGTHVVIKVSANSIIKAICARNQTDVSTITTGFYSDTPLPVPNPFPCTYHYFAQVTRISRDATNMPLAIHGLPAAVENKQFLGVYEADETEPLYQRIKIPMWVKWIRMRYRLSTLNITKMTDVLNLKSKAALIAAMRALKFLYDGDIDKSNAMEAKAVELISDEEMSRNPGQTFELQFDQRTSWADPLQGRVR
jgi:hypothetical protein